MNDEQKLDILKEELTNEDKRTITFKLFDDFNTNKFITKRTTIIELQKIVDIERKNFNNNIGVFDIDTKLLFNYGYKII